MPTPLSQKPAGESEEEEEAADDAQAAAPAGLVVPAAHAEHTPFPHVDLYVLAAH